MQTDRNSCRIDTFIEPETYKPLIDKKESKQIISLQDTKTDKRCYQDISLKIGLLVLEIVNCL